MRQPSFTSNGVRREWRNGMHDGWAWWRLLLGGRRTLRKVRGQDPRYIVERTDPLTGEQYAKWGR